MSGTPISQLPLSHTLKAALAENGYQSSSDLSDIGAADLAVELKISLDQAEELISKAKSHEAGPSHLPSELSSPAPNTQLRSAKASDLLTASQRRISTLSASLDALLGHFAPPLQSPPPGPNLKGKARSLDHATVVPGMVLELSGPPGGGKTAIALGMALSARVVEEAPEVLIVDTEGSITPDRIHAAAEALLASLPSSSRSPNDILSGIHLMRVPTQAQMIALLHTLDEWLAERPRVKLVVLDTLSYHFRQPFLELSTRKRIMDMIKRAVGKAATVHGCTVVATTQLATKLLTAENKPAKFETGDRAVLMPQLGDAWTTERTVRVALFRGQAGDDLRYAYASTSAAASTAQMMDIPWASFDIDSHGLPCDVPPVPL